MSTMGAVVSHEHLAILLFTHPASDTAVASSSAFFLLFSACLVHAAAGPLGQTSALPTCSAKARSCRHHRTVSNKEDLHRSPPEGYILTCLPCFCRHTQGPCLSLVMYQIIDQTHMLRMGIAVSATQSSAVKYIIHVWLMSLHKHHGISVISCQHQAGSFLLLAQCSSSENTHGGGPLNHKGTAAAPSFQHGRGIGQNIFLHQENCSPECSEEENAGTAAAQGMGLPCSPRSTCEYVGVKFNY